MSDPSLTAQPLHTGTAQPGWYPDPSGAPYTRWWDGIRWTEHTGAPAPGQAPGGYGTWAGYGYEPVAAPVSFGGAIKTCFRKYADFTGRASRSEFWFWHLFYFVTVFALELASMGSMFASIANQSTDPASPLGTPSGGFFVFYLLMLGWVFAIILPTYAVLVRRLRDAGFHWAFIFVPVAPLVMCCMEGKPGPQRYGY